MVAHQRGSNHSVGMSYIMADGKYKRLSCVQCAGDLTNPRQTKFCSKLCQWRHKDGSTMSRAEYRASVREGAKGAFFCECCGKPAYRNPAAKAKGYGNRWCSMACRVAQAERFQREVAFLHRLGAEAKRAARPAPRPWYKLGVTYIPPVRTCKHCGSQWSAIKRVGALGCCPTPECQAASKRATRSGRDHVTRARKHGSKYSYFNVLRVFARDGWRCQLCGVKTPKALRGTTNPQAPEIDHIIALSLGGDHLIENCQCACRRCNGAKGAATRGQMWLLGFADTR